MWFKNLALFHFTEPTPLDAGALGEALESRRFRPCGSLESQSLGWWPPLGRAENPLVHASGGYLMICLQREDKILPSSVVNEVAAERIQELEAKQGHPPGRKAREEIRDQVISELLPKAFSHTRRLYAFIDPRGGWLVVDSASSKKAEELNSLLRSCLGSLPVVPLKTMTRPAVVLTSWLAGGGAPADVVLESECELREPEEDGSIVRCRRQDLAAQEVQNHLAVGKEVVKLAFRWNERLSLMLDDNLAVRRLRFLDAVLDATADVEVEDAAQRFDADFSIMSQELARFLPRLVEIFGGVAVKASVPTQQ